MSDYLQLAANVLGVEVDDVLSYAVYEDVIAVVVDYGIAGGKKYTLPLSRLHEIVEPDSVDLDLGVYDMSYKELQALAKRYEIPANQSRDDLLAALWPYEEEE